MEKVILATRGHDCKPGDTRYLGPCLLNVDLWMQLPGGILLKDTDDKENKVHPKIR